MTKDQFLAQCDYFNMVHGVTLRAIGTFTDADLAFRPAPKARSPRELIFHMYKQEAALADGVTRGSFTMEAANSSNPESEPGATECATLLTVGDARTFADACHRGADGAFRAMSEDELNRPVESPFGSYPSWRYFAFAYDEHWHHRGQLYTYLRLLGKEPPGLYDFQ